MNDGALVRCWRPSQGEVTAYSSRMEPVENIHTSRERACAAGFRGAIVQGHHTLAVALETLRARGLIAIGNGATLNVEARYVAPFHVGDEIRLRFSLVDRTKGHWTITGDVDGRSVMHAEVRASPVDLNVGQCPVG